MSLKEIVAKPGQKEVTKENKNALKDALLKVLQQNGATQEETKTYSNTSIEVENTVKTHSEKVVVEIGEIPKSNKEEDIQNELPKQSGSVVKPGEIPEDQFS